MGKIRDYIKKHKKTLESKILIGGLALFAVSSVGLHSALKTNVEQHGKTFIVSNYDIGRGYVFVYNAEESGWEYLVEERGDYHIFVESNSDNKFKPRIYIRFDNLGKNHPLSGKYIYPKSVGKGEKIGEELFNNVRKKYKDHIPFQRILDRIKD